MKSKQLVSYPSICLVLLFLISFHCCVGRSINSVNLDNSNRQSQQQQDGSKLGKQKHNILTKLWTSTGGKTNTAIKSSDDGSDRRKRPLMPQKLPHPDTSYLLEFHTDNCDNCDQMEPVLKRLEDELGTRVRRINVFRRKEFLSLLENIGHDEFGGFPFYYNRRTAQAVGGATSYFNLKMWGSGNVMSLFQDPPENIFELEPDAPRGEVGAKAIILDKFFGSGSNKKQQSKKSSGKKESEEKKSKSAQVSSIRDMKEGEEGVQMTAAERTAARRAARQNNRK